MARDRYVRKPSAEEAREGYLLVLKDALGFFPAVGQAFALADGDESRRVRVDAAHCECRGPELPHDHYRLRLPGLQKGEPVTIVREAAGYRLTR